MNLFYFNLYYFFNFGNYILERVANPYLLKLSIFLKVVFSFLKEFVVFYMVVNS